MGSRNTVLAVSVLEAEADGYGLIVVRTLMMAVEEGSKALHASWSFAWKEEGRRRKDDSRDTHVQDSCL